MQPFFSCPLHWPKAPSFFLSLPPTLPFLSLFLFSGVAVGVGLGVLCGGLLGAA